MADNTSQIYWQSPQSHASAGSGAWLQAIGKLGLVTLLCTEGLMCLRHGFKSLKRLKYLLKRLPLLH